jgi:hypothetical protein
VVTGRKFADVLKLVADDLGIEPTAGPATYNSNGHNSHSPADPAEHLTFHPWDEAGELLTALWCLTKPPITVAAVRAVGGMIARYRGQYTVIALPVWGEALCNRITNENADLGHPSKEPVGWCLYNITGGQLPKWSRRKPNEPPKPPEWVKVKLTHGSQPGIIADLMRLRTAVEIWKVEGPSDLLAALSLPDLPPTAAFITNANGAKENPPAWMLPLFAGRRARVLHDADKPGQDGAIGWTDPRSQQQRTGWAATIASTADECRNVVLPYDVAPDHGNDLRDWLNEQPRSYADLQALASAAATIPQRPHSPNHPSSRSNLTTIRTASHASISPPTPRSVKAERFDSGVTNGTPGDSPAGRTARSLNASSGPNSQHQFEPNLSGCGLSKWSRTPTG